jgi:hypothetical protein
MGGPISDRRISHDRSLLDALSASFWGNALPASLPGFADGSGYIRIQPVTFLRVLDIPGIHLFFRIRSMPCLYRAGSFFNISEGDSQ